MYSLDFIPDDSSVYVDIKRRDSNDWIEVQSNVPITVLKCPIQSEWLENYEFRVDINSQESEAPSDYDSIRISYKNSDPTSITYFHVAVFSLFHMLFKRYRIKNIWSPLGI